MTKYFNGSLRNLNYRLRKFKRHLPTLLKQSIEEEADYIVNCIKEQLQAGENGKGVSLSEEHPYKPSTALRKLRQGRSPSVVTLYEFGDFYKGMRLVVTDDGFYITSSDSKTELLVAKYGSTIFRLNREHFNELLMRIRAKLQFALTNG